LAALVAGRYRESLVIVDGPVRKAATDMIIDIDSPAGRIFKVTAFE
jgi:hypothetical protein